jgi:peroxiredoxin family protein/TusA-related sulfurtransferase
MHASDPKSFHRQPAAMVTATTPPVATAGETGDAAVINACGLQCPGPILQLKKGMDGIAVGQSLTISATDPGFAADIPAWCSSVGHELLDLSPSGVGGYRARIRKCAPAAASQQASAPVENMTIVAFSGDWDKIVAAFIIANGAASMGMKPTIFCTFWGLNALRRDQPPQVEKTFIETMFGWMMPRGARKLALSKMHMAGIGKMMMTGIMKKKNVDDLPTLIATAQANGVRLVACAMSMDLMGIKQAELIDGVEIAGVASDLGVAGSGRVNLFI